MEWTTSDRSAMTLLLERSRSARAESRRLAARYSGVREHVGRERRRSLSATTAAIDIQTAGDPVMLRWVERLFVQIAPTTEIEQAKASHSNRKLRDVATELVHGASDGERATLDHAG